MTRIGWEQTAWDMGREFDRVAHDPTLLVVPYIIEVTPSLSHPGRRKSASARTCKDGLDTSWFAVPGGVICNLEDRIEKAGRTRIRAGQSRRKNMKRKQEE